MWITVFIGISFLHVGFVGDLVSVALVSRCSSIGLTNSGTGAFQHPSAYTVESLATGLVRCAF